MAHENQFNFLKQIKAICPNYFTNKSVLEIGSLDINSTEGGCLPRSLFADCNYVGIDLGEGRGVDIVCGGHEYDAPDSSMDVVLSCEVMEHNPYWQETFANMVRMCKPGGLVIMTCATVGRPEHGTANIESYASPITTALNWNYYRNLTAKNFADAGLLSSFGSYRFFYSWRKYDLYFCGIIGDHDVSFDVELNELSRYYNTKNYRTIRGIRHFAKALVRARNGNFAHLFQDMQYYKFAKEEMNEFSSACILIQWANMTKLSKDFTGLMHGYGWPMYK